MRRLALTLAVALAAVAAPAHAQDFGVNVVTGLTVTPYDGFQGGPFIAPQAILGFGGPLSFGASAVVAGGGFQSDSYVANATWEVALRVSPWLTVLGFTGDADVDGFSEDETENDDTTVPWELSYHGFAVRLHGLRDDGYLELRAGYASDMDDEAWSFEIRFSPF